VKQLFFLQLGAIPGTVFLTLGFIVLIGSIILSRRIKRKKSGQLGTFDDSGGEAKVRSDLEELAVQVQEIAREQIAKADVKIRMLNQLMIEADQKKQELENLLIRDLPAPKTENPIAENRPVEPPRPSNPLHEKIFSLSDTGKSALEICGETGLEIGEVEMILGIRKL
jgi:hypothetical protein